MPSTEPPEGGRQLEGCMQVESSRKAIMQQSKRIVVKLGTAVLMRDEGGIALSRFYSFVEGVAHLMRQGKEVLLVSSGAVGLGVQRLGLEKRPTELPLKQACAAVGQGILMAMYTDAFEKLGIKTAQVLLIEDDFTDRQRYLNLRSTIGELLALNVLPIINENDTVSTAEIESSASTRKVNFGDNDKLSALVAGKVDADVLLILTDVEGLYTADPRRDPTATLVPLVKEITPEIEQSTIDSSPAPAKKAGDDGKSGKSAGAQGRGGIRTKVEAAKVVTSTGCACIIAGGKLPHVIPRLFEGEELGTLFVPQKSMTGKLRWIAYATSIRGSVVVNEGAKEALSKRKASLLPAGVTEVKGTFSRGDVISILDADGKEFARGIANYSGDEAKMISGKHSDKIGEVVERRNYDAIITRDNIAFLNKQ